ncbi:hypothetical protein DYD21_03620 [Rhodohalobacter sp. SW132]|nr:hypothetical protein DYD21_03620 [Rhodohalobacter sp. SW132]
MFIRNRYFYRSKIDPLLFYRRVMRMNSLNPEDFLCISAHFCGKLNDNLRKEEQIVFRVSNFFQIHISFWTVVI